MHDPGPPLFVSTRYAVGKEFGESRLSVGWSRMNDEASCLVDHHEVVVLQNDLE
jgi:hypothetical protein